MPSNLAYLAAEYSSEKTQLEDYAVCQETCFRSDLNASCYRLVLNGRLLVVVMGDSTSDLLLAFKLKGKAITLPSDVILLLSDRREQANRFGPWVEGHYSKNDQE